MISARPFSPSAACLSQVRQLYETAFPVEEQIPWPDLMELMQLMPLDFRTYHMPDGTFAGFTIIYRRACKTGGSLSETKAYDWFWYFAVEPHLRGRGIGQEILSQLIAEYREKSLILDIESPRQQCSNAEQHQRRCAFYLRNGFRDTGVERSFDGIDYTILMRGNGDFTMRDYYAIISELRSLWKKVTPKND